MCLDNLRTNRRSYQNLSMESQPQNPEFTINPENFHPWQYIEKNNATINTVKSLYNGIFRVHWYGPCYK